MLYKDEEILNFIPQRNPIIMVDKLIDATDNVCHTGLTIKPENFFIEADGMLAEPALIEHIAQSASAFVGYQYFLKGLPAPVGYIGEVKNFRCYSRPKVGDELLTEIELGAEVDGVTLMTGFTKSPEGTTIAETRMKIYVENKE